jgi:transglutaminase-like putative cysteine protease
MPRLYTLFRFSTYLSLALATVCIGLTAMHSEMEGGVAFYLVVGLAILAAYLCEDRWLIPVRLVNVLALVILAGWILWSRLSVRGAALGDDGVDLLRLLLPRAGPLLSVLMLVKLFRPKRPFDYWLLHLLAVVQVVLGCVLALSSRLDRENLLFASMLTIYVLSAVWSLVLFYLQRELAASTQSRREKHTVAAPLPKAVSPWRTLGLLPSMSWFTIAFVLALMLFFVVPRPGHDAAATFVVPGLAQPTTGFSPGVDLNNVGTLRVNEDVVMKIEARDVHDRPINLGGEQRFRGVTCGDYRDGRWRPTRSQDQRPLVLSPGPEAFDPSLISMTFHVDMSKVGGTGLGSNDGLGGQASAVFLADPMNGPLAFPMIRIASRTDQHKGMTYRPIEPALLAQNAPRSRDLRYTQWTHPPASNSDIWVQEIPARTASSVYLSTYAGMEITRLPPAVQTSGKLAQETERILTAAKLPASASREQKARALEAHFVTSGQFVYSLEWQRQDQALDPTEDFLLNVKRGHCELFASALALMLRSQGIPSRVVIGFRGCEWNSLGDFNQVHQYHAHAWVEALLSQRDKEDRSGQTWTWLTLDPTPAGGTAAAVGAEKLRSAWDEHMDFLQYLWESLILDYGGESERERLLNRLARLEWLRTAWQFWSDLAGFNKALTMLIGLVVLAALVLLVLRHRRKSVAKRKRTAVAFYARLLDILEYIGLRPQPAQTAAEFSIAAGTALANRPATASLAMLPARIADLFYAVRFGGETLDQSELVRMDQELDALKAAVRA